MMLIIGDIISQVIYPTLSALLVIAMAYIIKLLRQLVATQAQHNRILYGESNSLESDGIITKVKKNEHDIKCIKRIIFELVYRLKAHDIIKKDEEFEEAFSKIK